MTLKEVGIIIGKKLVTGRSAIKDTPITVTFENTEIKFKGLLAGLRGAGKTVTKAKVDYCKELRGQILVVDAMLKTRREIQLPPKVTVK